MLPFLPLIGTALSGAMSLFGQSQTNSMMESMAANRYQTASADMQKAGLNPAMMFSNGGPAPMPQIQNPTAGASQMIQQGLSTAIQMKQMQATVENLAAQTKAKVADAANTEQDTIVKAHQVGLVDAQKAKTLTDQLVSGQDYKIGMMRVPQEENRALTARNQMDMDPTMRAWIDKLGLGSQDLSNISGAVGNTARAVMPFIQ